MRQRRTSEIYSVEKAKAKDCGRIHPLLSLRLPDRVIAIRISHVLLSKTTEQTIGQILLASLWVNVMEEAEAVEDEDHTKAAQAEIGAQRTKRGVQFLNTQIIRRETGRKD